MQLPKHDTYNQLYLDLDRTLYDTSRAAGLIRAAAADKLTEAGVTEQQLADEQEQFHQYYGEWYFYDFFSHMAAHNLAEPDVKAFLRERLNGVDLLFPDAKDLLESLAARRGDVVVLTFGDKRYQEFKYSLVPQLQDFRMVCIQSSKGNYIRTQIKRPSLIVDDKQILDLPDDCQGILIDRSREAAFEQADGYWIINDMGVVKELAR